MTIPFAEADRFSVSHVLQELPMWTVMLARDQIAGRDVAIRRLKPPFAQEEPFSQALAQAISEVEPVKHAGIERSLEMMQDEAGPFIISEPVKGMPLDERIRRLAPFSIPVAAQTMISVAEAVSALHRAGIVHGDLGEHHIRVNLDGSATVQNANLWKSYSASLTAGATVVPQMAPYMAPEISRGAIPAPTSDVYALGVIFFQLVTGRLPYHAETPVAMAMAHTTDPLPSARELNPAVPVALNEVLRKAMAKEPINRYPSATEFLSDIRMIHDALRFGRNLSWPIKKEDMVAAPSAVPNLTDPDIPKPVASGKSKKHQKISPLESDDEQEVRVRDVPAWLTWIVVFVFALVAIMVGSWLVVNLRQPKLVAVPELKTKTYAEAQRELKKLGLKVHVLRKQISETTPPDIILETDPIARKKLKEGDSVGVVLSIGGRFVEVPDLRGMTLDKARLVLDSMGLTVDNNIEEVRDRDIAKGMIVKQVPEPLKRVERRTAVQLTISSGNDRPITSQTDRRKYKYNITIDLSTITEPVLMRVDMTDRNGTRVINEQQRQPGEVVELSAEGTGSRVLFSIYYDGELITQAEKTADQSNE